MGFLGECCRVWFALTLILTLLPYALYTRMIWLLLFCRCIDKRRATDVNVCAGILTFRLIILLNPQIRMVLVGGKLDWEPSKQGPPAMYLMNHKSFFDFFVFTSLVPLSVIFRNHTRTLMAIKLFQMPILGKSIGDHVGSFRVYFRITDANSNDFGVDRDKQQVREVNPTLRPGHAPLPILTLAPDQAEVEKIQAHVESGGALAFCPEGTLNKSPPGLQLFRKGSFGWAVSHQMQVWGLAMLGNYECWPKKCSVGGYPCTIYVDIAPLLTPEPHADPADVAGACQKRMQEMMDKLVQLKRDAGKSSTML